MDILVFSFGLGGLLFALIATNDIAEHIEYKKRQKKLSALRLKRQIDEFDDYVDRLLPYFLPKEIELYCFNEMNARLDDVAIMEPEYPHLERLQEHVHSRIDEIAPLQALTKPISREESEDANSDDDSNSDVKSEPEVSSSTEEEKPDTDGDEDDESQSRLKLKPIKSEKDLEQFVALLRSFTIYVRGLESRSEFNNHRDEVLDQLINFKYEYIARFYTEKSQSNINIKKYARALTYAKKLHTLIVMSGFKSTRLQELSNNVVQLQTDINKLRGDAEKDAEAQAEKELEEKRLKDEQNHV